MLEIQEISEELFGIPISDITISLAYLKKLFYIDNTLNPEVKKRLNFSPNEITPQFIDYFNEYLRDLSKRKNPPLSFDFLLAHINNAYLNYTFIERNDKDFTRILKNKQLFDEKFRSGLEANVSNDYEIKNIEECRYCWFCNFIQFPCNKEIIFNSTDFKFAGSKHVSFCNRKDTQTGESFLFPIDNPNEMVCNRWELHLSIQEELDRRIRTDRENLLREKSREREREKAINLECV